MLTVVAALTGCSGSDDAATGSTTTAGNTATTAAAANTTVAAAVAPATTAPESDLPGIGDPVQDEQFTFVVTGIEQPGALYNPTGSSLEVDEATGTWLVIHMSVANTGDSTQPFMTEDQKLIWNGEVIEPPFSTWNATNMAVLDGGTTLDDVVVIFDVPGDFPDGGAGAVFEAHYSAFSDGAKVGF